MVDAWRFPRRSSFDTEGEVQRVLGKLEAAGSANSLLRLVANSESTFRPFVLMADALLVRSGLSATIRELVILRVSAQLDVDYIRREHELAARASGLSDEAIATALEPDALAGNLDPDQRLALRVTGTLLAGQRLGDEDWQEMIDAWGGQGALDLVLAIGWWGGMVATTIRGLGAHGLDDDPTTVDDSPEMKGAL